MELKDGSKIFIKNDILNKFLFVLRDNKASIPHPNMRWLLGGGIEAGETPLQAINRELKEEINIEVFDIREIYSKNISYYIKWTQSNIKWYYFIGKTHTDSLSNIILHEWQKVWFFSLKEISQMQNITPWTKELIYICRNDLT